MTEELKVEEIRTDNTKTLKNALERIAELEKENAELKETVTKMNNVITESFSNLTKAKELVRSLYYIIQDRIDYENNIGIKDEMWRAEQFLSC
jgi:uncharacterized coiled-coil protein SlyX